MLICRDGLIARPFPMVHDFERQLSSKVPRPTPSFYASPLVPQHETAERAKLDQEAVDVLKKVIGSSGNVDERRTKTWLEFQHVTTTAI